MVHGLTQLIQSSKTLLAVICCREQRISETRVICVWFLAPVWLHLQDHSSRRLLAGEACLETVLVWSLLVFSRLLWIMWLCSEYSVILRHFLSYSWTRLRSTSASTSTWAGAWSASVRWSTLIMETRMTLETKQCWTWDLVREWWPEMVEREESSNTVQHRAPGSWRYRTRDSCWDGGGWWRYWYWKDFNN